MLLHNDYAAWDRARRWHHPDAEHSQWASIAEKLAGTADDKPVHKAVVVAAWVDGCGRVAESSLDWGGQLDQWAEEDLCAYRNSRPAQ
jgi:hypothetical protein